MMKINCFYKKVDYNNLALISENIAMLYKEGISMIIIMDLLSELPLNKSYKESIVTFKKYILDGKSLEECFKEFNHLYPDFFIGMIGMGERSGNIYKVLIGLEKYCNKIVFIKNTIKNILSYPLFIFISTIILFLFIVFFTLPTLYNFFITLDTEVPMICLVTYKISNYIKENTILFLIYIFDLLILVPIFLYKYYLKDLMSVLSNKISIYKDFIEYVFILLLSIIIESGVNLSKGLAYAGNCFNSKELKNRFIYLNSSILKGESISISLINMGSYSNYTTSIVKLGEEGGSIDKRLESLSYYLEKRLLSKINKGMLLLQPISVIVMGLFIIIFLIVFILPLFSAMYEIGF